MIAVNQGERISRILKCWTRGLDFPNFEMLDARIASALNKISQNSQFKKEEGQSGGAESPKRGSVSTRKTDRLRDLRLLSSDWRS